MLITVLKVGAVVCAWKTGRVVGEALPTRNARDIVGNVAIAAAAGYCIATAWPVTGAIGLVLLGRDVARSRFVCEKVTALRAKFAREQRADEADSNVVMVQLLKVA